MASIFRFAAAVGFSAVVGYLALDAMTKWGVGSIGFAVFLNAIFPMWIVVVFHLIIPQFPPHAFAFYFTPWRWERQGTIYRYLGVLPFQTFLRITYLGWRHKADYRVQRDRAFLESMEVETRAAETAHGICFLVIAGFAIHATITENLLWAKWLLATGVFCQVYPMLLQRYHRPRWQRLLTMQRRRNSGVAKFSDAKVLGTIRTEED